MTQARFYRAIEKSEWTFLCDCFKKKAMSVWSVLSTIFETISGDTNWRLDMTKTNFGIVLLEVIWT